MSNAYCVDCSTRLKNYRAERCNPCRGERQADTMINHATKPEHLEVMREKAKAREARRRGYEITDAIKAEIIARVRAGESGRSVARAFGLTSSTVSVIVKYGGWAERKKAMAS